MIELYNKTKNIFVTQENDAKNLEIENPIVISDMLDFEKTKKLLKEYLKQDIVSKNFIKINSNECLNRNYILKIFSKIKKNTGNIISLGSSYSHNMSKILSALSQGWNFTTNSFEKEKKSLQLKIFIIPLTLSLDNSSDIFYYFSWKNTYLKRSILVTPDYLILIPQEIIKNYNNIEWKRDMAQSLLSSMDLIPNKHAINDKINNNLVMVIRDYLKYFILETEVKKIDLLKYSFILNNYNILSNQKAPSTNMAIALPLVINNITSLEDAMFTVFQEKIMDDYIFNKSYYDYICKYLIKRKNYELTETLGNLKFMFNWLKRDIFEYKTRELYVKEEEEKNKLIIKIDKTVFEKYTYGFSEEKIKHMYDNFLYIK